MKSKATRDFNTRQLFSFLFTQTPKPTNPACVTLFSHAGILSEHNSEVRVDKVTEEPWQIPSVAGKAFRAANNNQRLNSALHHTGENSK